MIRLLLVILLVFSFSEAKAADAGFYEKTYNEISENYMYDIDIKDFFIKGVKAIEQIDSNLSLSDIGMRYQIYYNKKLIKTIMKPQTDKVSDWESFLIDVVSVSKKQSKILKIKDFEIDEYILLAMFETLDENSRYYTYLDLGKKDKNLEKQRYFSYNILEEDVLYMKLGPLNYHTKDKIVDTLNKEIFRAIILDLRGNPGGLLSEAISIMNIFLDKGGVITSSFDKNGEENIHIAEGGTLVNNKQIIVLTDAKTASSAEILASSLRDQSIAKIVGARTKGKGTIQKLLTFDNEGTATITSGYFKTPAGAEIDKIGIEPDVCTAELDSKLTANMILENEFNLTRVCPRENREKEETDVSVALEMLR